MSERVFSVIGRLAVTVVITVGILMGMKAANLWPSLTTPQLMAVLIYGGIVSRLYDWSIK